MTKREEIREGVLTIDILNKAIDLIKKDELENEVIGFKVNPADLGEIGDGTMLLSGVVNDSLFMIPPYRGLMLEADVNQPRGFVKVIRKTAPLIEG